MIARWDQFGVIEAAGRNVDLVWKIGVLERELCPASTTERAHTLFCRVESRRFPLDDSEI
jgi:hypothetical protein